MPPKTISPSQSSSASEILLSGLNENQRSAVTCTEGPLLIIAGAGTGKTRVITHRLAYLLAAHPDLKPENILALTYTRKAAEEMLARTEELLPGVAVLPKVSTFHAFANELIQDYAFEIGFAPKTKLLTEDLERAELLHSLIFHQPLEHLAKKNKRDDLVEPVLKLIERAKDELISPEDLKNYYLGDEKRLKEIKGEQEKTEAAEEIAKGLELAGLYNAYEEALLKEDAVDYGGLIVSVTKALKEKPRLAKKISESFRYILVDEFQDTNIAQIELLRLLAAGHGNICAVGDDDQAIYRFRGASFGSFKKFRDYFPKTEIVHLSENYRSTKNIIETAVAIIALNGTDRYEENKKLVAKNPTGAKIDLHYFANYSAEAAWIAQEIRKITGAEKSENPFSKIAVLVRSKSTAKIVKHALQKENIPYDEITGGKLLEESEVKDAAAILKLTAEIDEENALFRLATSPMVGIAPSEYRIMSEWARKNKERDSGLARHLFDISSISTLSRQTRDKMAAFSKKIDGLKKLSARASAGEVFWKAASEFKLFSAYFHKGSSEARSAIRNLAAFYDFILQFDEREEGKPTLRKLMRLIQLAEDLDMGPTIEAEAKSENAVRLLTAHSAKGLEFPIVFIPAMNSRKFPVNKRQEEFSIPESLMKEALPEGDFHLEEERRLFYVALTRAREKIYLSCIEKKGTPPSRFVKELLASEAKDLVNSFRHEDADGQDEDAVMKTFDDTSVISLKMLRLLEEKAGDTQAELELLLTEFLRRRRNSLGNKSESEIRTLIKKSAENFSFASSDNEKPAEPLPAVISETEKIVLSPSKVEDYDWCPLKYQMKHEYGIPTPPAPFLKFGVSVHKALECFYKDIKEGKTPSLEDLLEHYEKNWERRGYRSRAEEDSYKTRGRDILTRYFETCQDDITNESISLEDKFNIKFSDTLELNGKIDRVQKLKTGEIEVIDYKTGKPKEQKKVDENIQLAIYALAFEQTNSRLPDRMTFHYLDAGEKVSSTMTPEKASETRNIILDLARKIRLKEFPPCETSAQYIRCGLCEYKPICPVHEK